MKKALVCKTEKARYVSDWEIIPPSPIVNHPIYNPTYTEVGMRIWEVAENEFDVHPDLFWVDCADDVTATTHYYENESIVLLPLDKEVPKPPKDETPTSGLNTI